MIASMMMYARAELADAHSRFWALIRQELAARDIDSPEQLANDADEFEVWTAPDLVLSQTCGMPYRTSLHEKVTLIGTPDFSVEGCAPGYYNSVIVVRADDPRQSLSDFRDARFTYNQTFSQSGFAAPYALCASLGFWFTDQSQSHGHRNSAQFVAEEQADIAAIDAVTWQFIERYDSFARDLRVLAATPATPGLPYIAAAGAKQQPTFSAIRAAIDKLDTADRDALGLHGIVPIPKSAYLAVENPPNDLIKPI